MGRAFPQTNKQTNKLESHHCGHAAAYVQRIGAGGRSQLCLLQQIQSSIQTYIFKLKKTAKYTSSNGKENHPQSSSIMIHNAAKFH